MSVLRSERLPPRMLAGLAILGAFPVVRSLLVADLNLCYPYLTADSYDWISNGLFWAGRPVLASLRPPGLPLLIAALSKLGALSLLPVMNFLFLGLSTAFLYLLLRERHDAWIAATAGWFFFANDAVLDLAKYVLAETYATPFLVLAALAFVRAGRDLRWYVVMGGALGAAFLFSYAAVPAGIGLALAVLAVRKGDVRCRELWIGALATVAVALSWFAVRTWFHQAHPDAPRHDFEALLRPTFSNLTSHAFSGVSLLGLLLIPLYAWGAVRLLAGDTVGQRYRAAALWAASAILVFVVFFYDWADKRFLVYVLPFFTCALAEGLDGLRRFAEQGRLASLASAAFLAACLLWNQIRYPSYGFGYLALSPMHFLEAGRTTESNLKIVLHLKGARVVRLHGTLASGFSRGLFDPRPSPPPCALADPGFACLGTLKIAADRVLGEGQPIGFRPPASWTTDRLQSFIRLRNVVERPVVEPAAAEVSLAGVEAAPGADFSRPPFLARCGPYVLVHTR
ncbi:MAG: glycosyltransferase family 39 protein [Thermoanaerobaculia bacterium]|nr:glycosyltransferase family 39 protein [Thermoanaerobaculia bacterium]